MFGPNNAKQHEGHLTLPNGQCSCGRFPCLIGCGCSGFLGRYKPECHCGIAQKFKKEAEEKKK